MSGGRPMVHKPAVEMGEFYYTQGEFITLILENFRQNLRNYEEDPTRAEKQAINIACHNMQITGRYFCRSLDSLTKPITPQEQAETLIKIGVIMAKKAIKKALVNAGVELSDIDAFIYTSHQPYPFPPLSTFIMNAMGFKASCVNIPTLSMGCAGGGFALRTASDWLTAHPDKNALIVNCELCSLGFRPHKKGMSWFLNCSLFGDALAATVVSGADSAKGRRDGLEIVHSNQIQVHDTTGVSFFTYDEWGYHFITTKNLCDVARENCPQFVESMTRKAFDKHPKDIRCNLIHPGGARMITEIGAALELQGTLGGKTAWKSMDSVGNIASATVMDMLRMVWDDLQCNDELTVVGMGPGFVIDGACLVRKSQSDINYNNVSEITLDLATLTEDAVVEKERNCQNP